MPSLWKVLFIFFLFLDVQSSKISFGTTDSAADLMVKFRNTFQRGGEKPSAHLLTPEKLLHAAHRLHAHLLALRLLHKVHRNKDTRGEPMKTHVHVERRDLPNRRCILLSMWRRWSFPARVRKRGEPQEQTSPDLCHSALMLSKRCYLVTINTRTVDYFHSIPHVHAKCCHEYSPWSNPSLRVHTVFPHI